MISAGFQGDQAATALVRDVRQPDAATMLLVPSRVELSKGFNGSVVNSVALTDTAAVADVSPSPVTWQVTAVPLG